jgi:hypothetical protein
MEKDVRVAQVQAFQTRSGNTRYVLRDEDGNEYTTFKEAIARQALAAEGRRARIDYHEQQKDGFTNIYLDRVEPLEEEETAGEEGRSPDEAAWDAAVEAAPWLLGTSEPKRAVPPDKLFEKLKPFQERVAEDIRDDDEDEDEDEPPRT